MDYKTRVEELGEELLQTPQYAGLEAARRALEEDMPAQLLLQNLEELREEVAAFRQKGEKISRETMNKVAVLKEKMAANQALKEYRRAQAAFEKILAQVREALEEKTGVSFPAACGGCGKRGPS